MPMACCSEANSISATRPKDQEQTVQSEQGQKEIIEKNELYIQIYKGRVQSLVDRCVENDIIPVLITQPLLIASDSFSWKIMQLYNKAIIEVAQANHTPVIDLAVKLEKKTEFFYDNMHFTNEGAIEVARIIFRDLEITTE